MTSRQPIQSIVLVVALALPLQLAAQGSHSHNKAKQHHYQLIDVGTFGGPNSYFIFGQGINKHGTVVGIADTPIPDPFAPNCFLDCFVVHAFKWEQGLLTDLGALTEGVSSGPNGINKSGLVAGLSQNGVIDPQTGIPELFATVWQNGQVINLGTFGGNNSYSNDLNEAGQVVGFAATAAADSFNLGDFCFFGPLPTQILAFIWQNGVMQNLGTLGGPDSCALVINNKGQAAGDSFTNSTPNPVTGIPTLDPFLWDGNGMVDLGTLGGNLGLANGLSKSGQVAGQSNLVGDLTFYPFRWSRGVMTDLGTFGGDNGVANWINDAGDVVGKADLPGSQTHDAFLWKDGVLTDLGTVAGDKCTNALSINSKVQIVGCSSDCVTCLHAFLWENGGPMIDLNTVIPPDSGLTLTEATLVKDDGEIAAQGVLPNGDTRAVLLIPCDEKHGDSRDCEDNSERTYAAPQMSPAVRDGASRTMPPPPLMRRGYRYHMFGRGPSPTN